MWHYSFISTIILKHFKHTYSVFPFFMLCNCSSRRTVSGMVQPAAWWTWSWMTQMMEMTTLLSSTNLASEASTPLGLARTQRPGSTALEILAGNGVSACLFYFFIFWGIKSSGEVVKESVIRLQCHQNKVKKKIFNFLPEYWGYVCCRMNSVQSH